MRPPAAGLPEAEDIATGEAALRDLDAVHSVGSVVQVLTEEEGS